MPAPLALRPLESTPEPRDREALPPPPGPLRKKLKIFWKKTLEAGRREERRSTLQRVKQMFWDYNVGQIKGWYRGLAAGLKDFLNPRSSLFKTSPEDILIELQELPETALDYGIAYMEADWKTRGQLNTEKSVGAAMWLLKIYLGLKGLKKGIFKAFRKF